MREIKFRVWDHARMGMSYDLIGSAKENMLPLCLNNKQYAVMQHTGLKDKNGVEIWESDLAKVKNGQMVWRVIYEPLWCAFVLELLPQFGKSDYISFGALQGEESVWFDEMEVIGNIYENPELLKEES